MSQTSSAISTAPVAIPAIPLRALAPWALFFGSLLLLALYFVSSEQGALSIFSGTALHEFVHDGRHLLGYPCH